MSDKKNEPSLDEIDILRALISIKRALARLTPVVPPAEQEAFQADVDEIMNQVKKIVERWDS